MYDMAENNGKKNFTEVSLSFNFLRNGFSCKICYKNFFDKCLLFHWLNWIYFLPSDLIWQDSISLYLQSRINQWDWLLFEKLKGNYSLKRKKQPVRVIRKNSCMLKEAATASYSWKAMFLIFINTEIVRKLK